MLVAAIALVVERVLVSSVAGIAQALRDEHHVLVAAKSARTSALRDLDLAVDDLEWLAALRAVCDSIVFVAVGLDAREAESC